jgi:hypothetical protein
MIQQPVRLLLDTNLIEAGGREKWEYQGISGNPTLCHVYHWFDEIPSDPARAKEVRSFWGLINERLRTQRFQFCVSEIFRYESQERPLIGSRGLGYNEKLSIEWIENVTFQVPYYGSNVEQRKSYLRQHILNSKNERLQNLLKHFGHRQSQDCAHLLCAETSGIEFFLTMDLKFVRSCESRASVVKSPVQVITPSEFCRRYAIDEANHIRDRDFGRYDWQGVPLTKDEVENYQKQNAAQQ